MKREYVILVFLRTSKKYQFSHLIDFTFLHIPYLHVHTHICPPAVTFFIKKKKQTQIKKNDSTNTESLLEIYTVPITDKQCLDQEVESHDATLKYSGQTANSLYQAYSSSLEMLVTNNANSTATVMNNSKHTLSASFPAQFSSLTQIQILQCLYNTSFTAHKTHIEQMKIISHGEFLCNVAECANYVLKGFHV